ncbi:unnamed protein product [Adineta steineri]|uniref:F-box domain-containing protein n=1 Tax=Adineta steineri TaxID=433720 RepID=A0A819GCD0_9BILA|nr:unnamed protein product [Adineta steineri]CAF3880728.1 unnamed protein product [Adineta steineri]
MPRCCFLDLFPVELLHTLFTYFLAYEIFLNFSDVSDYVSSILLTYSAYQLDFKGIRKSNFNLICRRIQPHQVISLTISDNDDTPCQSELFFSHFRIEQFTHLQSIKLIMIDVESSKSIFTNLYMLKQLCSFSFDRESVRCKYPEWNHSNRDTFNQLDLLLIDVYSRLIPQLDRLHLNSGNILRSISLSRLRHLRLKECSLDDLETIFRKASQLKSLQICHILIKPNVNINLTSIQLTRLNLSVNCEYFSISITN